MGASQLDFTDQLAVVTGGGSGIGAATARLIAAGGGRVVVLDRSLPSATAVASEIGAHPLEADVAEEDQVRHVAERIAAAFGRATILVNCAGVLQRTVPPGELTMKEWDLIQRVDLRGLYLCCAIFGGAMAKVGKGAIVNVASVAGMRSAPLHSYGPAKAAVISLTECLAAEWGPSGVRVNAVSPGFTRTPALDRSMAKGSMRADLMARSAALGRLVEADEIAAAIGFLASDLASAITGVNVAVDAGYLVAVPWASYGGIRAPGRG